MISKPAFLIAALCGMLLLTTTVVPGDVTEETKKNIENRSHWNLHELVTGAPVIVKGRVEQLFGFENEARYRLFRVTVEEVLKGGKDRAAPAAGAGLYLVEALPADSGRDEPPLLFPASYLLFLEPVTNARAVADLRKLEGPEAVPAVFSVHRHWRGAVSLDEKWTERSNRRIAAQHEGLARDEIASAVASACRYLAAPAAEKEKLRTELEGQGALYREFLREAGKTGTADDQGTPATGK